MRVLSILLFASLLPAQVAGPASAAAEAFVVSADIQYANVAKDQKRNRLDLYLPKDVANPPLVMFVHGGTWMTGSKERHAFVGETLARHGYAAAVINYSLSPFVKHPAHVEDCAAAFAWLYRHAAVQHFDREAMFVMGHSAGGHLVALLALDHRYLQAQQVPIQAIKGVIGLSGVYDVRPRNVVLDGVFGRDAKVRAAASPFLHASAAAPPFLLLWADNDIPGLPFCARMLKERLRALDVPVQEAELPQQNHASYVFRFGGAKDVLSKPLFAFLDAQRALAAAAKRPAGSHDVRVQRDLGYGDAARQRFDLYLPATLGAPLLVLAHGSLWDHGSRTDIGGLARALAAQGIAVACVDYALAPDVYPAALQDLAAAVAHLQRHAGELGFAADRLYVGGNGGGAVLALAIADDARWLRQAGVPADVVRGVIALSPPADLQRDRPEFAVFPDDARRQLSPLVLVDRKAVPTLLLFGGGDAFAADARLLQQQLLQVGRQNVAFELPGRALADVIATAGTADDEITAPLLAFLRQ